MSRKQQLGIILLTILSYLCSIFTVINSQCQSECNLALASYYTSPSDSLDMISSYFDNNSTLSSEIVSYNRQLIPNKDSLQSGIRINIPFPCGCVNDTFQGHLFSYVFQKKDNYELVAMNDYANLTTGELIQSFNSFNPNDVPVGTVISVPVNCSCGNGSVSKEFGLFITYPLRGGESLSSVSKEFGLNESLLQGFNPGVDFSSGAGIVFIPGKDQNGNYPPLVVRNTSSSRSGLAAGLAAGISVVAVVVIIVSIWVCLKHKKKKEMNSGPLLSERSAYQLTHQGSVSQGRGVINPSIDMGSSVEFSYEELAKATDDFNLRYKIGEGGYGAVYFAELRGQKAAIKKMDMQATREFLAELKVLTRVHHLNLLGLLGYCVEGSLFLISEYIENGNLSQHLRSSGRDPLPWSTRVKIALDAARGLEYIHEHTDPVYIHRDIKPANILINQNFLAKVADFGLAKLSEVESATLPTRLVGTFGYMAPEYAQFGEVSPKIDVFAFGVVLYELISAKEAVVRQGRSVAESTGLVDLFEGVLSKPDPNELCKLVDPRLGDDYPLESVRQVAELAKACTQDNPQLRPSMRSVVVALTTLSSATGNWDIDAFYGNDALMNRVSGR